jgi:hypothetical protein
MAVVGIFFGNRMLITAMAANPLGVLLGFAWVGIYAVAGYLIGERRASGGVIGLALFAYSLVMSALTRRLVSWDAALAVVGIVLILRAGRALRLPFWPGARPPAAPPGESGGPDRGGTP